jgi:excisionase family DNA binding protein
MIIQHQEQDTPSPIHPERLYTTSEVARVLGLHPDTVYRISSALLRRTRIGPKGGRTRVRGADLIRYLEGRAA